MPFKHNATRHHRIPRARSDAQLRRGDLDALPGALLVAVGRQQDGEQVPRSALFSGSPGMGRTRSWARPRAVSRCVRSRAISVVVAAERAAMAVRAEAMANRF